MTQGRLTAFAKVQEYAKDSNLAVVLAALDSPRNMYQWTSAEQAVICPWAASMVGDNRPAVAAKASSLLGSCSGPYIDQLLASGETALASGKFTATQLTSYRELCPIEKRGQLNGPSNEQCARCRKLLGQVIEAKSVDEQTRSSALISLAYQWPDETTLKLSQRLAKGKDQSLAEHAKRTVERLEQRQSLEQKNKQKQR